MNRLRSNAFTIIEVLVSVLIISFVGWGVLQLQQNTVRNIAYIEQNFDTAMLVSPLLIFPDKNNHNKSKNLYDFVKERYTISYDPMIAAMKQREISYWQKEFAFIPLEDGESTLNESGVAVPKTGLSIQKVVAKEGKGVATVYGFEVIE